MKPNIILITSDKLIPYDLDCYGGDFVATPNIDRLAARGTVWETAIKNFTVCMAARSALISSQQNRTTIYPDRPGDFNMPEYPYPKRPHLPDSTLAEGRRAQGYAFAGIGKRHMQSWPHEIGFDHYTIPRVPHAHSALIYSRDGEPGLAPAVPRWTLRLRSRKSTSEVTHRAGRFSCITASRRRTAWWQTCQMNTWRCMTPQT